MPQALTSPNASQPQSAALQAYIANKPYQSKHNSYYSRVRIAATSLAANTYTCASGAEVTAFGYNRNQDMAAAGLPGVVSTPADTNLTAANQTISGEAVEIHGIGLIVLGQSDANFLKQGDQCISVKLKTNGTTDYLLGIPSMVPSPGGLFGNSEAASVVPSLPDQVSRNIGIMGNGVPKIDNYFQLAEPMMWVAAGKGDSSLNVILKVERAFSTIAAYGGPARTAGTGIAPYTPPTFANVFIDYMVVLIGRTVNPLSSN